MSYFDDASLVMIPSGYKDQKVYSVKPIDGSGDLTFSRASNATRVNSSGLVEKVRENLLIESQAFDLFAPNAGGTVDANVTTAPDGTTTADRLNMTSTGSSGIYQVITVVSGVEYSQSVYVKNDSNATNIRLGSDAFPSTAFVEYNAVTGTIVATGGSITQSSVTDAGNGWKRISLTYNSTGIVNSFIVYNVSGSACSVFLWGGQVEAGVTTSYIPTLSTPVSVGPVSGLPRLDYSGGASCPSLLLEGQRTNVCLWSENFDNAGWTKASYTISANAATSPDGYVNADKLTPNNGASLSTISVHALQQFTKAASAIQYTYSVFAKDSGLDRIQIFVNGTSVSNNAQATFSLTNGTISTAAAAAGTFTGASASVTDYGNGWYRCALVFTTNTDTALFVRNIATDSTLTTGNGTDGILAWGAQLEAGAYATSYIPTLSSAVTRVADTASKTGISSLIGQTEGSVFIDMDLNALEQSGQRIWRIGQSGLGFANAVSLEYNPPNQLQYINYVGGVLNVQIIKTTTTSERLKIAVRYKQNDFAMYINGILIGTDTSATIAGSFTDMFVGGNSVVGSGQIGSGINQFLIFPTALPNADLATLTTL